MSNIGNNYLFRATDDPNSRIGMTFYSDMNAVETFAQNQFNHDITPVYYDTFDIDCYFILQRIVRTNLHNLLLFVLLL